MADRKNKGCGSQVSKDGAWKEENIAVLGGVNGMLSVNSSVSAQGLCTLLQLDSSWEENGESRRRCDATGGRDSTGCMFDARICCGNGLNSGARCVSFRNLCIDVWFQDEMA